MPALLKSTSTRPCSASTAAKSAAIEDGSATSVGRTSACPSAPWISSAVSSSGSRRRPASTSANPSPASCTETARPIPEPAPVTTATFT